MPLLQKAQVGMEFLVVLSVAILLLTVVVVIYAGEERNNSIIQERLRVKHAAQKIALEVNRVFLSGNGTSEYLELDRGYNVSIQGRSILVEKGAESASFPLLTDSAANFTPLNNSFSLSISNQNGVVVLA